MLMKIPMVGVVSAKKIDQHLSGYGFEEVMSRAPYDERLEKKLRENLKVAFSDELYRKNALAIEQQLYDFEMHWLSDRSKSDVECGGSLSGQVWVLTGTLSRYSRTEARDILISLGAQVSNSLSKKTTHLLAGDKAGSKLSKAEKLGTKIVDENEFLGILKL